MRNIAAFSLALLFALPLTALADPAGDYAALITAAQEGDPGTDYTAMRQAYAMIADYDPYGRKTNDLIRDGEAAYVAKDCKTALEKFRAAIALSFTLSDAHALSADCLEQAGDKAGEAREEAIAQGLFDSVIISGDGESPETAFHVVTLHEEGVILAIAGLHGTAQALLSTDHGPVDKISVVDPKTGQKSDIFFNVSALMIGTASKGAKPEETPSGNEKASP
jgi:hypothetical protein